MTCLSIFFNSYKFFIKFLRPLQCSTQVIFKVKFTLPRKRGNNIMSCILPDRKTCSVNFLLDDNLIPEYSKTAVQIHAPAHAKSLIHHSPFETQQLSTSALLFIKIATTMNTIKRCKQLFQTGQLHSYTWPASVQD